MLQYKDMAVKEKTIIGRIAQASFPASSIHDVPVKIDTGADTSSVWASELHIDDDFTLHYALFAKGSPYYTGKLISTKAYKVTLVRSSNGTQQIRYSVKMTIVLGGRRVRASFTLADRSNNTYPVLIGNRLLYRKFLVDVSYGTIRKDKERTKINALNDELALNPKEFFEKYHLHNTRGDVTL